MQAVINALSGAVQAESTYITTQLSCAGKMYSHKAAGMEHFGTPKLLLTWSRALQAWLTAM